MLWMLERVVRRKMCEVAVIVRIAQGPSHVVSSEPGSACADEYVGPGDHARGISNSLFRKCKGSSVIDRQFDERSLSQVIG